MPSAVRYLDIIMARHRRNIAAVLGSTHKAGGRISVESDLTLPGHPEVLVIGDMAYLEQDGSALPMIAPVVMQMGI